MNRFTFTARKGRAALFTAPGNARFAMLGLAVLAGSGLGHASAWADVVTTPAATHAAMAPISAPAMAMPPGRLPAPVADALRAANIPPEAASMLVWPVDSPSPRLDHLSQLSRQPASVAKLFTTGAALLTFGPAFTWRTDAALGGPLAPDGRLAGPLFLRGSGDPSLVLENIWLMMSRWRAAGLRDIQGGIVMDRFAFDLPVHDAAAFDGAPLKPYNAGPDALLLNHGAVTLRLMPDASQPGRARVSMEPALDGVQLEGQVLLLRPDVACGAWRERLSIEMQAVPPVAPLPLHAPVAPHASASRASSQTTGQAATMPQPERPRWTLSVRGAYPSSCEIREWPLLWPGSGGDHAARALAQIWRDLGGQLGETDADLVRPQAARLPTNPTAETAPAPRPPVRDGAWPDGAVVWQSWVSPPLLKVVQDINKFSNNVMARQLFLTLSPQPGPATLDKAREAVSALIRLKTRDASAPMGRSPCDGEALVLDNGSGLSRLERSSAACLGRWLQALWASPVMPELLASLPVTGVDGTARRLGTDAGTLGQAHIKTGSLDGVMAIAGIVHGQSGRRHIVVGIVNHPQAQGARPAMDALLGWAAQDR